MKKSLFVWSMLFSSYLFAQVEPKNNKIIFNGYTFEQRNYSERNCVFAKIRKDTMKEFLNSYDTLCSHVEFFDLTVSGPNAAVVDAINNKMKTMSLNYGEESYNSPQLFCSSIADSYAKDGFIEWEGGIYFRDSFKTFCNLEYAYSEYTGGAFSQYFVKDVIFNTMNGAEITINDVIDIANQKEVKKILYNKFVKTYGKDALLIELNKPEEFPFPESCFTINSHGIYFNYNFREITAYCYGSPEIDFSFNELYPYLTPWFKQFIPTPQKSMPKKKLAKTNANKRHR